MASVRQRLTRVLDGATRRGVDLGPYEVVTQRDLRIPMDDGSELLADLYTPVGVADSSLPTIVIRGPYGRRGMLGGTARVLAYEGFVVLFASSRGTWGSHGTFHPQVDEQRDGVATLRWVRQQPWFTGRLATFGESYMGYTQWAVAGKLHREEPDIAPEALVLQVTMPDFGAITWDNGAFSLRNALGWSRMMDRMERGGPAILGMMLPDRKLEKAFDALPLSQGDSAATGHPVRWYQDWVKHENLADEYWTQQSHAASVAISAHRSSWSPAGTTSSCRGSSATTRSSSKPATPPIDRRPMGTHLPGQGGTRAPGECRLPEGDLHRRAVAPNGTRPCLPNRRRYVARLDRVATAGARSLRHGISTRAADCPPDLPNAGVTSYTYDPERPTPSVGGPQPEPKTDPLDNAPHAACRRRDVPI